MRISIDVKRVTWGTVEIEIEDHETVDDYDDCKLREMAEEKLSTFEPLVGADEVVKIDRDSAEYKED